MTTLVDPPEQTEVVWTNYDNDAFYTAVDVEGLKEFAKKGGLDDGCDVLAIKSYWESAKSILDVGSGYGRVIEALLKNNFSGKITAIERNAKFFNYLKQQYSDRVTLHNLDIHDCSSITERFDVILFLWSSLADFPFAEQSLIVQQLASLLAPQGLLIFDSIPFGTVPIEGSFLNKQLSVIKRNANKVYIFAPILQEIQQYANSAKLNLFNTVKIITSTNRVRNIHILGETRIHPLPNKH